MTVEETICRNLARRLTPAELEEQALLVLVYGVCRDALNLTPEEDQNLSDRLCIHASHHMRLNAALSKIFTFLKDHGLHPVLLKGQGCATYYPTPYFRITGDLDIWVGQADYEKAKALTKEWVANPKAIAKAIETPKHLHISAGMTDVEIHSVPEILIHPLHNRYYRQLSAQEFTRPQNVLIEDYPIQIPSPRFQALQVFMHLWHHFTLLGIGLRHFIDLAFILHHDYQKIHPGQLLCHLQKLGRLRAWRITGCLLVDILGLPQNEFPLYQPHYHRHAEKLFQLALNEGNFGRKQLSAHTRSGYWYNKSVSFSDWCRRLLNSDLYAVEPTLPFETLFRMSRNLLIALRHK